MTARKDCHLRVFAKITPNVFGLGEVAFVRWILARQSNDAKPMLADVIYPFRAWDAHNIN